MNNITCDICGEKVEEDESGLELCLETYDLCQDCRKKIIKYIDKLKKKADKK